VQVSIHFWVIKVLVSGNKSRAEVNKQRCLAVPTKSSNFQAQLSLMIAHKKKKTTFLKLTVSGVHKLRKA
jgi:hypothetical protein